MHVLAIYRHQASESSAVEAGAGDDERDRRLKKAMNLLQQRKQLQRNLRTLQQRTISTELPPPSIANGT